MAKIIYANDTEGKNFVDQSIEIYTSNRIGQYSKYQGMTPIYVTYFPIDKVNSKADKGTGNIQKEIGFNSPLRFTRINNLPIYNIPELRPVIERDEKGYDIDLQIDDLGLLPNTIKPNVNDYFIVDIPNVSQILFRVINWNYTTIQTNGAYTITGELKKIGKDVYSEISKQVTETYDCIFQNIGTEDKCFIKKTDNFKIIGLEKCIFELEELFIENYFDENTGIFGFVEKDPCVKACVEPTTYNGLNMYGNTYRGYQYQSSVMSYAINDYTNGYIFNYDLYMARFINDSRIFDYGMRADYKYQIYDDLEPDDFDRVYRQTIFYALLKKSLRYLRDSIFESEKEISLKTSIIKKMNYSTNSTVLFVLDEEPNDFEFFHRYFSKHLLTILLNDGKDPYLEEIDPDESEPPCEVGCSRKTSCEYAPEIPEETPNEKEPEEILPISYIEQMIIDYFFFSDDIRYYDQDLLTDEIFVPSKRNFRMHIIALYILHQIHDQYFKKLELTNTEESTLTSWQLTR